MLALPDDKFSKGFKDVCNSVAVMIYYAAKAGVGRKRGLDGGKRQRKNVGINGSGEYMKSQHLKK